MMNERIKELAQQAQKVIWPADDNVTELTDLDIEKFAELIVQECLSIVKSNTYGPNGEYDYSYSDEDSAADHRAETIYEEIAYRFGVEPCE
jgi:hypothetical protein